VNAQPIQLSTEVEALLVAADLPVSDLRDAARLQLFGHRLDERLVGVVGVEAHGEVGLLRSLAVASDQRGRGLGRALVADAEDWAASHGIREFYLLTTTAAPFFAALRYVAIPRSEAPAEIAATAQFASLCPSSSTFMRKLLTPGR
jgi:amino-acid N-acetyltransferase